MGDVNFELPLKNKRFAENIKNLGTSDDKELQSYVEGKNEIKRLHKNERFPSTKNLDHEATSFYLLR